MLRVTNTLTRAKEPVSPHAPGRVRMYTCGPTVYRYMHVGNLRSFLLADLVRRALEVEGLDVEQVQNVTDVGHMTDEEFDRGEDKMLVSAQLEDRSPAEIAAYYTEAFRRDVAAMNLRPARAYPRASDYVPRMIELVRRLAELGNAYEVDGDVYFAVESFPDYGRLSGNSLDQLRAGHRMEAVDPRKRHHADFALWPCACCSCRPTTRASSTSPGTPWRRRSAPWSAGAPGWPPGPPTPAPRARPRPPPATSGASGQRSTTTWTRPRRWPCWRRWRATRGCPPPPAAARRSPSTGSSASTWTAPRARSCRRAPRG